VGGGDESGVWMGDDERSGEGEGEGDCWIGIGQGLNFDDGEGDTGVVSFAQRKDGF